MSRLDRFTPVKEVAQIGAAIGHNFSFELIAAVAPRAKPELEQALSQLVASGLAFRQGTPPDAVYSFKHALVRDAAYESLLKSRRQELHGKIARAIEEQLPQTVDQQPELLAEHWEAAGHTEGAITYCIKAGWRSNRLSSFAEAIAQARKGLGILPDLDESSERSRQEMELHTIIAWALIRAKGESAIEGGEALLRARILCEQQKDIAGLGPILYMHGVHLIARADYRVAQQVTEELLHLSRAQASRPSALRTLPSFPRGLLPRC